MFAFPVPNERHIASLQYALKKGEGMELNEIKKIIISMGGFDIDELTQYENIIKSSYDSIIPRLKDKSYKSDMKILNYAAASAYYTISLCEASKDGFTTFTAGDITIKTTTQLTEYAKEMLNIAERNCRSMISDDFDTFAFFGV